MQSVGCIWSEYGSGLACLIYSRQNRAYSNSYYLNFFLINAVAHIWYLKKVKSVAYLGVFKNWCGYVACLCSDTFAYKLLCQVNKRVPGGNKSQKRISVCPNFIIAYGNTPAHVIL